MPPHTSHFRRGMTLVELLVVVAIFLVLAVTVLPALSATAELRRGREAARMVSSFIAKAQWRAIGRREWSGFQLVPWVQYFLMRSGRLRNHQLYSELCRLPSVM